jgi:ribosomal protein L29
MKKSNKQSMRAKSADDLRKDILGLRGDMLKSRMGSTLEGKRMAVRYRANRRQIARIETILRERELAQSKAKA